MEGNRKLHTVILFCAIFILHSQTIHAETVYNFFFNPEKRQNIDTDEPINTPMVADSSSVVEKVNPFCIFNYFGFSDVLGLGCDDKSFTVGSSLAGFSSKTKYRNRMYSFGAALDLKYNLNKGIGLFGEAIFYSRDFGEKIVFALGSEITVLRSDVFFSKDNIAELGVEVGWSNLKDWNIYNGFPGFSRDRIEWFGGVTFRLTPWEDFSLEYGLRRSFSEEFWMAKAGLGYSF